MSDIIVMRHPTLPDHQEIEVPKDAMPHYSAAGWQLVPAEELEKRAALKARAAAEAAAAEETGLADAAPEEAARPEAREAEAADEPEPSEPAEPTKRPARSRANAPETKGE